MCVHVSLVPVIGVVGEQKTKPTQHSVATLRSLGINPALLACRSSEPLQDSVRSKLVRGRGGLGGVVEGCVEQQVAHCSWLMVARLLLQRGTAAVVAGRILISGVVCPRTHHYCGCAVCPPLQAAFCHVPADQVLTMHDVSNIWRVPLMMQAQVRAAVAAVQLGWGGRTVEGWAQAWIVLPCCMPLWPPAAHHTYHPPLLPAPRARTRCCAGCLAWAARLASTPPCGGSASRRSGTSWRL